MNNSDKFNKWFNIFILTGMTLAMVAATLYKLRSSQTDHALLIVAAFGSLMGVLSTVCSANAKILTFLFGLFDVSIYGVMCYMSGKYGNAALHLLYFLPMQFVGFFQWRKRGGASSGTKLKARRLGAKSRWIGAGAFLAGSADLRWTLSHLPLQSSSWAYSQMPCPRSAISWDSFLCLQPIWSSGCFGLV